MGRTRLSKETEEGKEEARSSLPAPIQQVGQAKLDLGYNGHFMGAPLGSKAEGRVSQLFLESSMFLV